MNALSFFITTGMLSLYSFMLNGNGQEYTYFFFSQNSIQQHRQAGTKVDMNYIEKDLLTVKKNNDRPSQNNL